MRYSTTALTILCILGKSRQKRGRFRRNADHTTGSDNTDRQCCSKYTNIRDSSRYCSPRRMNRQCACTCQRRTSSTYTGDTRLSLYIWRNNDENIGWNVNAGSRSSTSQLTYSKSFRRYSFQVISCTGNNNQTHNTRENTQKTEKIVTQYKKRI